MARRDKYHINYEKLYPGIEIPPEVLSVLRKGDRKEEYQEVDLKQERFVYDPETKTAYFIPGREDSYERLIEDEKRQFSNEDPMTGKTWMTRTVVRTTKALSPPTDTGERFLSMRSVQKTFPTPPRPTTC